MTTATKTAAKINDIDDALELVGDLDVADVADAYSCAECSESVDDVLANLRDLEGAAKVLAQQARKAIDRLTR